MEIILERCAIRDWREGDQAALVRHANNVDIWRNLRDIFPNPYTEADADNWIRDVTAQDPRTDFAIDVEGEAVGGIGVRLGEDIHHGSAEIGFWLSEDYWGRGLMTEAVLAMTEFAFERFGVGRIWAGVFERNTASMRVLEKAGYEFEGRLRRAVIKDGEALDQLIYARLSE